MAPDGLADPGYCVITLAEAPLAVNVRIGDNTGTYLWHGEQMQDLGGSVCSVVEGEQVVPIMVAKDATCIDTGSVYAAVNGLPEKTNVRHFPYKLAFALTDYALQGRTLNRLVINWPLRSYKICAEAVYVLISRCRTRAGLRFLDGADMPNLRELSHSRKSHAWIQAYGPGGIFSDERAKRALHGVGGRKKRGSPKRTR
jgi:hypothetical protein